jgi:hypothetical protein
VNLDGVELIEDALLEAITENVADGIPSRPQTVRGSLRHVAAGLVDASPTKCFARYVIAVGAGFEDVLL